MTTYFGSADIQSMIDGFGVPVTCGGVTANGLLETPDQRMFATAAGGQVMGQQIIVIVKTGTFPGLAHAQLIVADGTTYKVVSVQKIDDGALTHVLVTPVQS